MVQLMDALSHPRWTYALVELECRWQGPNMLICLKTAGGEPCPAGRALGIFFAFPRFKLCERIKRRDQRKHFAPHISLGPHEAGAPRAKDPLVRARGKRIAPHGRDPRIFNADAMDAVNNQQNTVF